MLCTKHFFAFVLFVLSFCFTISLSYSNKKLKGWWNFYIVSYHFNTRKVSLKAKLSYYTWKDCTGDVCKVMIKRIIIEARRVRSHFSNHIVSVSFFLANVDVVSKSHQTILAEDFNSSIRQIEIPCTALRVKGWSDVLQENQNFHCDFDSDLQLKKCGRCPWSRCDGLASPNVRIP